MDSLFDRCYGRYFRWNEELFNHFFANEKREILLYVDDQLLEKIGQKIGLDKDYKSDFIASVENFCINYNLYTNKDSLQGCEDPRYKCSKRAECSFFNDKQAGCMIVDPLIIAHNIIDRDLKYYKKFENESGEIKIAQKNGKAVINNMPFFAIVVYIILMFDNGNSQQWENVNTYALSIKSSSRKYVLNIWDAINRLDERFDKNASIFDRSESNRQDYVGRILFHLPLSISSRNKIWDALYKSSAWKVIGARSFFDIVGLIMSSLNNNRANNELKDILAECMSTNDYNCIAARKVQSAFDDFNIETYNELLKERASRDDYKQTLISGKFALGIYLQEVDEQVEYSIVLLTTVQHEVEDKNFYISEGGYGTLSGYSTSLVKYKGSTNVEIKDYSLKTKECHISSLGVDDVVFFYKYNDSLYIQTRDIIPSKAYVIAVRKGCEEKFELWCEQNKNNVYKYSDESSQELCGPDWTIFYTEDKLNGQYYDKSHISIREQGQLTTVVLKGGIEKVRGTYFINALPYFEIPDIYEAENIDIYMNLNGKIFEDYTKIISKGKLILDIPEMPIKGDEYAYANICLEYNRKRIGKADFNVCGQVVMFNSSDMYHFDRFGRISNEKGVYSGNYVEDSYRSYLENSGLFSIKKEDFTTIDSGNLYLTNLIAARCFSSENSEISYAEFNKCLNYATTRLGIDILQDEFEKRVRGILSKAGLVHFDYERKRCQAVAPSFIRVPFSIYQTNGTQLILLSGCYTKAFIADLLRFCRDKHIPMFRIEHSTLNDEMKLLPPIILIGHNFSPEEFCEKYNHQCNAFANYDFALSLVNLIPSHAEIGSLFKFQKESEDFAKLLEPPLSTQLPRIRVRKSVGNKKVWYIEKDDNLFAEIGSGHIPWAYMYCHHEHNIPLVGVKNQSVYLPTFLELPDYIHRALYQMNLGFPVEKRVFMLGRGGNSYFVHMNEYTLHSAERCRIFASKVADDISCEVSNRVKIHARTNFRMWLWINNFNGQKYYKRYLILCENQNDILAIAYKDSVFVNCNGRYRKIMAENVNDIMTFLIAENWKFLNNSTAIGYSHDGGVHYRLIYEIGNEELIVPDKDNLEITPIEII